MHKYWNPLHITMRGKRGLPTFRAQMLSAAFEDAVRRTKREDFRIVEFSVQDDHLHLIIEADVYCLNNYKKHQGVTRGAPRIDPCSSARWFQGWTMIRTHDDGPRPGAKARTLLLRELWQKHGFIHPGEAPRAPN